jgi:hypothetical protein
MSNSDRVKILLALLSEFNNRSRWYSSRIWQIPFAYFGISGILYGLMLKTNTVSIFLSCFFIILGIIGLFVFLHMVGLMNGERRAVSNLQKVEKNLFENVLKNNPNLQPARYVPYLYVFPLALIVLMTFLFNLYLGFSLLNIAKALMVISYLCIILGSIGMVIYFIDFPFSTSLADAMSVKGYHIPIKSFFWWLGSWLLIIIGTTIQLLHYLR